jgi:uncharacterized protein YdeI (YjbR/CyaY-like superfamily)
LETSKSKSAVYEKTNSWSLELEILKSIVAKTELIEIKKWGGCVYTLNGKNIIGIGGFKNYFAIWFFNGVFLKDTEKNLINAQEGVTKSMRQWRFFSKEELEETPLLKYILEAIENEKEGKKLEPEKKKEPIPIPLLFQKELDANSSLSEAFFRIAPYKQRAFLEYITEAKREDTKLIRIEKIKLSLNKT